MHYNNENDDIHARPTIHNIRNDFIHIPPSSKRAGLSEYYNRYQKVNSVLLSGTPITIKPRSDQIIPIIKYSKYYPDEEKGEPSTISELIKAGQPINDPLVNFFDDINGWDYNTEETIDIFDDNNQQSVEDTQPTIKKRFKKKSQRKEELKPSTEDKPKTPSNEEAYSNVSGIPALEEKVEYEVQKKVLFSTKGLFQQAPQVSTTKKKFYRGKLQSASSLPTKLESLKIYTLIGERIHNQSRSKTAEIHPLPKPETKLLPIFSNLSDTNDKWGIIEGNKLASIKNNTGIKPDSPKQLTSMNYRKGPKMLSAKGFRTIPIFSTDTETLKLESLEISNVKTLGTQEPSVLSGMSPHQDLSRLKSPRDFRNQVKTARNKVS